MHSCAQQSPEADNSIKNRSGQEVKQQIDTLRLENVDPAEIITDDWSDEGDLELEIEE